MTTPGGIEARDELRRRVAASYDEVLVTFVEQQARWEASRAVRRLMSRVHLLLLVDLVILCLAAYIIYGGLSA